MDEISFDGGLHYLYPEMVAYHVMDEFVKLKTHEERFKLVLESVISTSNLSFDDKCKKKLSEHSKRSRQAGNNSYMSSQYYKALQEYTESIVYAIDSSEDLALAYANRSAALYNLDKYEDCIQDIDRALNLTYPNHLKTKLYKRKGQCLMSLGKPGAASAFEEAVVWLEKTNQTESERSRSERELKNLILIPYSLAKPLEKAMKYELPKILTPNPNITCASDAVGIKYSENYGRHIVAARNIRPGEILVVEEPFCKRLNPEHVYRNCSHCLLASWNMIPCNHCVNVAYCSETCRDKAWDEYHEIECPTVGLLRHLNVDDPICLSMRMAIMATKKGKKLDALKQELINIEQNTDPCASLYSDDGKLHNDEYRSIHCSQEKDDDDPPIQKLISGAVGVAIAVCILARQSEMFGKKLALDTLAENSDVVFVGGLMFKHIHLGAQIKTHRLGSGQSKIPVVYGTSLMAVGSLFNHSCDANTARQWNLGVMIIYAIYPIGRGEQIFDNYGPNFTMMMRSQRQENFKRWKFVCHCVPCTQNWPLLDYIPSYKVQKLTPQNRKKIDKVLGNLKKCKFLTRETGKREPDTFNKLVKTIETLFALTKRPCKELVLANHMLKLFYSADEPTLDYEPINSFVINMERNFLFAQLVHIIL